jgi:hypothetical protein
MKFPLMTSFGIELEYMVVHKETLNINPIVDVFFEDLNGAFTNEIKGEPITWSNELVAHVIELKNDEPASNLINLDESFSKDIKQINKKLKKYKSELLPSAMHPWMNPDLETKLWPHENNEIYSAYDQIFGCKGHGWSNLQSMHINLGFENDEEFGKLHAAVRLILPLIPALSSSSPIFEQKKGAGLSSRLNFYLENQRRIPSILGHAIPERAWSKAEYEDIILKPMYKDISPLDKNSVLQYEWLNSRAAIPKFERDSLEIRLCDINENAFIDISIALFWVKVLKTLIEEKSIRRVDQKSFSELDLKQILISTINLSGQAQIENLDFLKVWGFKEKTSAQQILKTIFENLDYTKDELKYKTPIEFILNQGTLSERLLIAIDQDYSKENLFLTYKKLTHCLDEVKFFEI